MDVYACEIEGCQHVAFEVELACEQCGWPACGECSSPLFCPHLVEQDLLDDPSPQAEPMRKRLRVALEEGCVRRVPELLACGTCGGEYCKECWIEYAIRYTGYEFTPQTAYRYAPEIQEAALLLYCYNKRRHPTQKIPRDILLQIIGHL